MYKVAKLAPTSQVASKRSLTIYLGTLAPIYPCNVFYKCICDKIISSRTIIHKKKCSFIVVSSNCITIFYLFGLSPLIFVTLSPKNYYMIMSGKKRNTLYKVFRFFPDIIHT